MDKQTCVSKHKKIEDYTDFELSEAMHSHVFKRGGLAKDDEGNPINPNGAWAMMVEASKRLTGETMKEKEEQTSNVIPFSLPKPDFLKPLDDDWLKGLKSGTIFICQERNTQGFMMHEFMRTAQREGRVGTYVLMIEGEKMFWVNSRRFSQRYELCDIIEEPSE